MLDIVQIIFPYIRCRYAVADYIHIQKISIINLFILKEGFEGGYLARCSGKQNRQAVFKIILY